MSSPAESQENNKKTQTDYNIALTFVVCSLLLRPWQSQKILNSTFSILSICIGIAGIVYALMVNCEKAKLENLGSV